MLLEYQVAVCLALLATVLSTLYNLRHMPRLAVSDRPPRDMPLVSVLVPARDEASNIRPCLESLLAQDYPNLEIWVLDDASSDGTGDIVRAISQQASKVRFIKGQPLPDGWHGKAWACHRLSQAAQGRWLLFTDADTHHAPHSVTAAVSHADRLGADLLTLLPHMVMGSFWERVVMAVIPFAFVGAIPLPLLTRTRTPFLAGALGPFLLFRRETYLRLGGHESVRSDIAEDVFLARRVKRVGGRIAIADGTATLSVQFYRGFAETWRGLTKSTFAALNYSMAVAVLAVVGCYAVYVLPYAFLYHAYMHGLTDYAHFSLPLTQIVLAWIGRWLTDGRFRIPRRYALLQGLTVLMGGGLVIHSALLSVLGPGTAWKGRVYQFRRGG